MNLDENRHVKTYSNNDSVSAKFFQTGSNSFQQFPNCSGSFASQACGQF